jgi:site-specific recombinase XerD
MTTSTAPASTAIAVTEPVVSPQERLALAGFLTGYTSLTREAYALDLRQFTAWCQLHHLGLFQARRADIECFARDLEARGRARATITRRLCTVAGFYRYAVEEELLEHSPAAHVRRPRLDYESHATALDRNELGAILVAAGLGPAAEHALISLLALNGLRVSEATGSNIEALGVERGHRTLTITRKGGKIVTIPLAPRTARALDLAISERSDGPLFLAPDGRRLDRYGAARIVRRVAGRAGGRRSRSPSSSASPSGRSGETRSVGVERPASTACPRSRARPAASVTSLVLPTPASPMTTAQAPRPPAAQLIILISAASSSPRPTTTGHRTTGLSHAPQLRRHTRPVASPIERHQVLSRTHRPSKRRRSVLT